MRLVYELLNRFGKPGRLVERDERVAVGYLNQPSVREEFGEAASMLGRHDAVLACPDDEGGALGARLFISPRTVEYHLHRVFTKLDIASRSQLEQALPAEQLDAQPVP
jgi:hypothetical protein